MQYPCILIERVDSDIEYANNHPYFLKKQYQLMVITRDPKSVIPDLVEGLQYARIQRVYRTNGLHHFVINLFY